VIVAFAGGVVEMYQMKEKGSKVPISSSTPPRLFRKLFLPRFATHPTGQP
jgi:hypothetical protein